MNTELLVSNIGFIISAVICLGLGVIVYIRRPAENAGPNKVLLALSISITIYLISYVVGTNLHDPYASRAAFMFNLSTLFLIIITTHLVLVMTDRIRTNKVILYFFYTVAVALTAFYAIFPDQFLSPSQPRLYLANFFVPGPLYGIQDVFYFLVAIYLLVQIVIGYIQADWRIRNKIKYFVIGIIYAFVVGTIPELLLYGYPVDPIFSALVGLYVVPMAYGIIKHDAMDINLLAKRTFGYSLSVAGVTLFILLIGYVNDLITTTLPQVPQWLVPLISAGIAVGMGFIVWRKMKEVDLLKYQFIDVVTHKFRTPLTHIRWSVENLRSSAAPEDQAHALDAIDSANARLFELTNILVGLSNSDNNEYLYKFAPEDVGEVVNETIVGLKDKLEEKKIQIEKSIDQPLPKVLVDRKKFQFVIQMILENAVNYSHDGVSVKITAVRQGGSVVIAVIDHGIGISKDNLSRIFSKFYRSTDAVHENTEGLGIGLYLSRSIMRGHGGDLRAESAGPGLGSTFYIKVPVAK